MPASDANGCSVGSMRHASGAVAEHVDDLPVERNLLVEREVAGEERLVDLAAALLGDQRHELGLHLGEDPRDLGRLHLRLEVVEQDVVRLVRLRLEAFDVAAAQLDVALERPEEELEVRTSPSPRPRPGRPRTAARVISTRSAVGTRTAFS